MNMEKSPVRGLQHYPLVQQIELWQIDKLIPYAKNPRTHSDAQVAQIAGSIAAFGFNAPILVDSNAGVIAGHGRLLASRQLGLEEVPVIVLDHLTEIEKRAYLIADNKLGENAGWDDDLLREQLAELREADTVGVPGGWPNRFKNAWEPVFHFCRQPQIKFRPKDDWGNECL